MNWLRGTAAQAGALVLVGVVGGGVVAATVGASASSGTPQPTTYAAGPGGADGYPGRGPGHGMWPALSMSGTVTSVGSNSVTIKVSGTDKTYAVDANSDIDKSGDAKLSDLKPGDAVRFALRPDGKTIAVLHTGDEAKNMPRRGWHGFGGPMGVHRLPQSGTVTSVGPDSVTIKVNGADKTYAVDANSDIDKSGDAKLSDLKPGDAVRFALRPDGKTIAVLHAGDEAKNMPAPGMMHGDHPWGPPPSSAPSPS